MNVYATNSLLNNAPQIEVSSVLLFVILILSLIILIPLIQA